jgi:hypothetical protein
MFVRVTGEPSGTIEIRAEADRVVAIASWRDIGPNAALSGDGCGAIATNWYLRSHERSDRLRLGIDYALSHD